MKVYHDCLVTSHYTNQKGSLYFYRKCAKIHGTIRRHHKEELRQDVPNTRRLHMHTLQVSFVANRICCRTGHLYIYRESTNIGHTFYFTKRTFSI